MFSKTFVYSLIETVDDFVFKVRFANFFLIMNQHFRSKILKSGIIITRFRSFLKTEQVFLTLMCDEYRSDQLVQLARLLKIQE